jgi:8-oxo-dGTP pyrophosphatase MutT (NUDIX family)
MSSERPGPARASRAASPKEPAAPREPARPQERSAGGVVVRGEQALVIVPHRRAGDGSRVLGLPKGHIDPGETALGAAVREVREETGVKADPVQELGEVRYWYRRDGRPVPKSVVFYLLRYRAGDTADHDDEVEEVRWMDLAEACTALTYEGEREMARRALAALDPGGEVTDLR